MKILETKNKIVDLSGLIFLARWGGELRVQDKDFGDTRKVNNRGKIDWWCTF